MTKPEELQVKDLSFDWPALQHQKRSVKHHPRGLSCSSKASWNRLEKVQQQCQVVYKAHYNEIGTWDISFSIFNHFLSENEI